MYITRVLTKRKDGGISHTCILLRESYYENGKVKNRTLCNLTHLDPDVIAALEAALKNPKHVLSKINEPDINSKLKLHNSIGASYCVYSVCKTLGIEKALGNSFDGKLALVQIISRVINQGSRLAAVRFAKEHSLCDILEISKKFNEDDLYNNLSWLSKNQNKIEKKLFKNRVQAQNEDIFLYDVTSSYLEGTENHFAQYGYNRDGKKGKKQIVLGCLCDIDGNPISIKVYNGNTNDTKTFADQIKKAEIDFGCKRVTFVGDRGMIKSGQISDLKKVGFHYITAIAKAEIETLLKTEVIQMNLFDREIYEIKDNDVRYILRKNETREKEIQQNRADKLANLETYISDRNEYLKEHPKAKVITAMNKVNKKLEKLKLHKYISIVEKDRNITIDIDNDKIQEISKLDGCYIIKTDLPNEVPAKTIHSRYKDLSKVEWAFRTSKTAMLELRPWFVRKEGSSNGHAFVVMLAYHVAKALNEFWINENNTVKEILNNLSRISTVEVELKEGTSIYTIPKPNEAMQNYLDKAGVALPKIITKSEIDIDSKVKLQNHRKPR